MLTAFVTGQKSSQGKIILLKMLDPLHVLCRKCHGRNSRVFTSASIPRPSNVRHVCTQASCIHWGPGKQSSLLLDLDTCTDCPNLLILFISISYVHSSVNCISKLYAQPNKSGDYIGLCINTIIILLLCVYTSCF